MKALLVVLALLGGFVAITAPAAQACMHQTYHGS